MAVLHAVIRSMGEAELLGNTTALDGSITHVVSGGDKRTLKVLQALSLGPTHELIGRLVH